MLKDAQLNRKYHHIVEMTTTYPVNRLDTQPDFIQSLCKKLSQHFTIDVLTPSSSNAAVEEDSTARLKITRYRYFFKRLEQLCYGSGINSNIKEKPWRFALIPFLLLGQLLALVKVSQATHVDLLHAHWIIPQGLVAVLYRKLFRGRGKLLITSHGGDLYSVNSPMLTKLKSWVLKNADFITVVSSPMRTYCIDNLKVNPKKISILPMGVDIEHRFSIRERVYRVPGSIIFVGRLVEKKGVETLLKALSLMGDAGWTLKVIGDGPLLEKLKNLTDKLAISEQVTFLGAIHNSEIADFLYSSDIAVLPFEVAKDGDQEGLGLTTVEAMACGCAVIAADLPAVRDVITDREDGILFRSGNVNSLKRVLEALFFDTKFRKNLQESARNSVYSRFDWEVIGLEYAKLIEKICLGQK